MQEYTLIPTRELHRIMRVLDKMEPLLIEKKTPWVTKEQAMELLNVQKSKLYKMAADGLIKCTNSGSGRNVQYCRKSIEAYLEQNSNR
jgi:excisionase family DNA binding protein